MPEILIETITCDKCEYEYDTDDLTEFDGEQLCSSCLSEYTTICSHCGSRIWSDDNSGNGDIVLCRSCYENYYYRCSDCNALVHSDDVNYLDGNDDGPYCADCYHDRQEDEELEYVNNYSYKPDPVFYGEGLFLGVELEVDSGGLCDDNAHKLLQIANKEKIHAYIKQDGSLTDGLEIVTHPMSLDYHMKEMPWREILHKCVIMGYKSHRAGTCGLHCHISRDALGKTYTEQELIISNILYFIEAFWPEMLRFSRRTEEQMNRWASRYGRKNTPREQLEHAKNYNLGRYACLNLANRNTIEFRLFRGTLKYQSFIATLQLVDEICKVAISLPEEQMQNLSWRDFILSIDTEKKPELIEYLKIRQLYVNEPLDDTEEDL